MSNFTLNPCFLAVLAEKHPACARAVEISLYALTGYVLGVAVGGEVWSTQAALTAFAAPLLAFINKRQRDLAKDLNQPEPNPPTP